MKKIILLIFIALFIIPFSGCANKKDINEISTAIALGIDKAPEGGYAVTVQIVNPIIVSKKSVDVTPAVIVKSSGKTVKEAMARLSDKLPNELFIFQIELLIFSREVAEEGIEKFIDVFAVDTFTQHKYNIIIVENDTAENTLKIQTIMNQFPALAIHGKLQNSYNNFGLGKETFIDEAVNDIKVKGTGLVLATVKVEGDIELGADTDSNKRTDPDALIQVSRLGVFKEDKLVGFLEEHEALGYKYILSEIKISIVNITLANKEIVSVKISSAKSKIKFELINNQPTIKISGEIEAAIEENVYESIDKNYANIDDFEMKITYEITEMMKESIKKAKQLDSDIFEFIEVIHRQNPKYYQTIINNYDNIFPNIQVEINMKTKVKRIK